MIAHGKFAILYYFIPINHGQNIKPTLIRFASIITFFANIVNIALKIG